MSVCPYLRPICPNAFQARQFEFHCSQPVMAVGTIDGEVALLDWNRNFLHSIIALPLHKKSVVLALCWLRKHPQLLLTGTNNGYAFLLKATPEIGRDEIRKIVEEDGSNRGAVRSPSLAPASSNSSSSPSSLFAPAGQHGNGSPFQHSQTPPFSGLQPPLHSAPSPALSSAYVSEELNVVKTYQTKSDNLTSVHASCDDAVMVCSGYSNDVHVYDLQTGELFRVFEAIHKSHINIARFANHMPSLLLTCSFDKCVKLWDIRCGGTQYTNSDSSTGAMINKPIYSITSNEGNVMVCFSPSDNHFLASAVDNDVVQYRTIDGKKDVHFQIPPLGVKQNYTRSYYANDGETVVSGSSASDEMYVCCSTTGKLLHSVDVRDGRRNPNLYIQSLRGNALQHNRCCALIYYKYSDTPFELIDIDLNRDAEGHERELPFSPPTLIRLTEDFQTCRAQQKFTDVALITSDGKVIYAHHLMLMGRWDWYRHAVNAALTARAQHQSESSDRSGSSSTEDFVYSVPHADSNPDLVKVRWSDQRVVVQLSCMPAFFMHHLLEYFYTSRVAADCPVPAIDEPHSEMEDEMDRFLQDEKHERSRKYRRQWSKRREELARRNEQMEEIVNKLNEQAKYKLQQFDVKFTTAQPSPLTPANSSAVAYSASTAASSSAFAGSSSSLPAVGSLPFTPFATSALGSVPKLSFHRVSSLDDDDDTHSPSPSMLLHSAGLFKDIPRRTLFINPQHKRSASFMQNQNPIANGAGRNPLVTATVAAATATSASDSASTESSEKKCAKGEDAACADDMEETDSLTSCVDDDGSNDYDASDESCDYLPPLNLPLCQLLYPLILSDAYFVYGLSDELERILRKYVNLETVLSLFRFAVYFGAVGLRAACEDFIANQLEFFLHLKDDLREIVNSAQSKFRTDDSKRDMRSPTNEADDMLQSPSKANCEQEFKTMPAVSLTAATANASISAGGSSASQSTIIITANSPQASSVASARKFSSASESCGSLIQKSENFDRILSRCSHLPFSFECLGNAVCTEDNIVFSLGGYNSRVSFHLDAIFVFDVRRFTWSLLACSGSAPPVLVFHTAVKVGNLIIVFGGGCERRELNDVYVLDCLTLHWRKQQCHGRPPAPRKRHSAIRVSKTEICVYGGRSSPHTYSDIFILNVDTWHWQEVRPLSPAECTGRYGHGCLWDEDLNEMIIIGGQNENSLNDVWSFSFDTLKWTCRVPNVYVHDDSNPRGRFGMSVVKSVDQNGAKIFVVFGGVSMPGSYLNDLWILEAHTDRRWCWRRPEISGVPPSPRFGHHSFPVPSYAFSDKAYFREMENRSAELKDLVIIGGADRSTFRLDVRVLDLKNKRWLTDRMCYQVEALQRPVIHSHAMPIYTAMHAIFLSSAITNIPKDTDGQCSIPPLELDSMQHQRTPVGEQSSSPTGPSTAMAGLTASSSSSCVSASTSPCAANSYGSSSSSSAPSACAHPHCLLCRESGDSSRRRSFDLNDSKVPFADSDDSGDDDDYEEKKAMELRRREKQRLQPHIEIEIPNGGPAMSREQLQLLLNPVRSLWALSPNAYVILSAVSDPAGRSVVCSRAILSARSSTFSAMFESSMSDGNESHILLHDIRFPALRLLVHYIYTGDLDFSLIKPKDETTKNNASTTHAQPAHHATSAASTCSASSSSCSSSASSSVSSAMLMSVSSPLLASVLASDSNEVDPFELLLAADQLGVDHLAELMQISFGRQLDVSNVCQYLQLCQNFTLPLLRERCLTFAVIHFYQLKSDSAYLSLSAEFRKEIEQCEEVLLHQEKTVGFYDGWIQRLKMLEEKRMLKRMSGQSFIKIPQPNAAGDSSSS